MVLTVSLPYPWLSEAVGESLAAEVSSGQLRLVAWDMTGDDPDGAAADELDVVVLPFHSPARRPQPVYVSTEVLSRALRRARRARVVQTLSIGVEGLAELLPAGARLHNATGVMEAQTAELAAALILALRRDLPGFARDQGAWRNRRTPGLVGTRIVVLGHGGVGQALLRRLDGFDAELVAVARRARIDARGTVVHQVDDLPMLLPGTDVLAVTLPLTEQTRGMVGAEVLAALPDGASVVNVGRGAVIDSAALLAELQAGRLTAGLDVTDPEPLPEGNPLWHAPGVIVTPHVGGNTDAMPVALAALVTGQIHRLLAGREPVNPVAPAMARAEEVAR